MVNFTQRLDRAIRIAAWAHEQAGQHRKASDIPYIIHPFGVMLIASNVTDNEDTLISCLFHDILEDVDSSIYDKQIMRDDFGDAVVAIVKDVTKDDSVTDWHERSKAYLHHLENEASDEAVIVSASDKIHNLLSTLSDYETHGDQVWNRFSTKNAADQLWWYESILVVITKRKVDKRLIMQLEVQVVQLRTIVSGKDRESN
jgi:(p)ppGpp synthase/HD superfamily hydrolase